MDKFKPKIKKDEYELDDNDYLLIQALVELRIAINRLINKIK